MATKLVFSVDFIGGKKTVKDLYNMEASLKRLTEQYKEYMKTVKDPTIDRTSAAFKDADKNAKSLAISMNDLKTKINATKKELRNQVKDFDIGAKPKTSVVALELAWSKLRQQLREMSNEDLTGKIGQKMVNDAKKMKDQIDQFYKTIGDHKANVGNYPVGAQLLGDLASRAGLGGLVSSGLVGFQAAGAIGAASAAGAAAVAAALERAFTVNKEIDTIQGNIKKTTGLTNDEVERLTDNLARVDSITSTMDLLRIAEEAGRFGVEGVQGVESFTKAVNLLAIGLGDEMGGGVEHIATTIAQLSNVMYGATNDGEEMARHFLALGNVLNGLANTGAATAEGIANVSQRMSSTLIPLGFAKEEILGISSAILESGINAERGSTSFMRVQAILRKNFVKVAEIIGEDARTFAQMLDTKPVEAFNLVVERTRKIAENSGTALAVVLGDMGIHSQYAMEVFNAWGNNMSLFNTRIAEAGELIGNINTLERDNANITDTVSGQWARLKNAFNDFFISSGLQSAIKGFFGAFATGLSGISEQLRKFDEYASTSKFGNFLKLIGRVVASISLTGGLIRWNPIGDFFKTNRDINKKRNESPEAQLKRLRKKYGDYPDDILRDMEAFDKKLQDAQNTERNAWRTNFLLNPTDYLKTNYGVGKSVFEIAPPAMSLEEYQKKYSNKTIDDLIEEERLEAERQRQKEADRAARNARNAARKRELELTPEEGSLAALQDKLNKLKRTLEHTSPESTMFPQLLVQVNGFTNSVKQALWYVNMLQDYLAKGGDPSKLNLLKPMQFDPRNPVSPKLSVEYLQYEGKEFLESQKAAYDDYYGKRKEDEGRAKFLQKAAIDAEFASKYTPIGAKAPDYSYYLQSVDIAEKEAREQEKRIRDRNKSDREFTRDSVRGFRQRMAEDATPLLSAKRARNKSLDSLQDGEDANNYAGITLEDAEKMDAIRAQSIQTAMDLEQAYFDFKDKLREENLKRELKALDREYNAKKVQAQGNETLLEAIEIERAGKEEELRKKAFEEEKKAKIAQAIIGAALAIIQAFANTPPFIAPIIAAGVGVTTALQIAAIRNSTYAEGGYTGEGTYRDSTGHKVAGIVHDGEYVVNKKQVKKHGGLINFLEQDRLKQLRGYAEGGLVTNYNRVPNSLIRSNYNKEVSSIDMSMLYETIARATHDGTYTGAAQGSASGVELGQVRAYRMQDRVNRQQNAF